jgi:hypothetical protein
VCGYTCSRRSKRKPQLALTATCQRADRRHSGRSPGSQVSARGRRAACARVGPRCGPSAAAAPARIHPQSRSTSPSPLASCLRPCLAAPGCAGAFVPLRRPMRHNLESKPQTEQQIRHSPQCVVHPEQPGDQRRDPGQRPPLVLVPAAVTCGRDSIQRRAEPGQLVLVQLAGTPARPF